MSRKFTYKKRSFDEGQKRTIQGGTAREGFLKDHVRVFSPKEDNNYVRIMPPTWEDAQHYGIDVYVHYGIGSDNSSILCPNKMSGKPCPICEERDRANAEGDEEYAKKLKPIKRVLVYVVDRDKESDGVKMWPMAWTIDKTIMIQATNERTREILAIDDPEDGYDVEIKREGKGQSTKYTVSVSRNSSEIEMTDDIIQVLEDHPLDTCLIEYDYETISKLFVGTSFDEEDDSDKNKSKKSSEEKPKTTRAKKEQEDHTWRSLHKKTFEELDEICEDLGLDIENKEDLDLSDYADEVCNALEIKDPNSSKKPDTKSEKEDEPENSEEDDSNSRKSRLKNLKERRLGRSS